MHLQLKRDTGAMNIYLQSERREDLACNTEDLNNPDRQFKV